jgi:hypothetical protein
MLTSLMNIILFVWLGTLIFGAILKVVFKKSKYIKVINNLTWTVLGTLTLVIATAVIIIVNKVQVY